jgi:hypothetical protein
MLKKFTKLGKKQEFGRIGSWWMLLRCKSQRKLLSWSVLRSFQKINFSWCVSKKASLK